MLIQWTTDSSYPFEKEKMKKFWGSERESTQQ